MKKNLFLLILILASLTFCFAACASQEPAADQSTAPEEAAVEETAPVDTYVIKIGHVVQDGHSWDLTCDKFAELIYERTEGRYQVEVYPARQLGDDNDLLESVISGTLDGSAISASVFENYNNVLCGLQLPWLFENVDQLYAVYTSDINQQMLDELSTIGLKALAIYDCGFRHFTNTYGPITTPADMAGKNYRAVSSPLVVAMYTNLGTIPTTTAYGEIYTSLQTGVIEGLDIGFKAGSDEGFYEVAKYVSVSNHFTFPVVLTLSDKFWNSLTPEDQDIFSQTALECIDYNFEAFKAEDSVGREAAIAMGVQISEIEDIQPFRDLMADLYTEYTSSNEVIKDLVEYVDSL